MIAKGTTDLSTDDLKTLQDIDELSNTNTSDLVSANPHLSANIQPIQTNLGKLGNFTVGSDGYGKNLTDLTRHDRHRARPGGGRERPARVGDQNPGRSQGPRQLSARRLELHPRV